MRIPQLEVSKRGELENSPSWRGQGCFPRDENSPREENSPSRARNMAPISLDIPLEKEGEGKQESRR
jgi:hypothetical protein